METLNIIELIEKNPVTKLSQDYNVKLLEKIKNNFTDFEQHIFLSSFYCYLNCHNTNDFVINLDDIWKWLGFSKKQKAKLMLQKNFIINNDYKIVNNQNINKEIKQHGGHNKEVIMLNITTFKKFCLKAETNKANEIHEYYIKLEEIIKETIEEENNQLKQQLQQKDNMIIEIKNSSEEEKQKAIEKTLINQFPLNTECVYIGKIENTNSENEKLIKFGHTNNLHKRVLDHRKNYNNFILIDAFKVQNKVEIESLIKSHHIIKKQIRTIQVNEKNKTEIIAYDESKFTINKLTECIKEIINSKMYSIDNFNKLLKQNEELLNENELLKNELKILNQKVVDQELKINELNENVKFQENKLQLVEIENQSVYQNSLLPQDEQINTFNNFINNMCIVRSDVEESSVNMEGAYRIWNKIKPTKEIFHAFKSYLDTRFKPTRLSIQHKNQVVYGYIGVKLKNIEYKKRFINNDVETFLFQVCRFCPSGKILNTTLVSEYQRWKQSLNKECNNNDIKDIKSYLNNCEYVLRATVWLEKQANEGYYGISLKTDEYKHKTTSSTGKKVEKIENKTGQVIKVWDTIAKAAADELISAAKMSRSIKNKVIFNNDYYYRSL